MNEICTNCGSSAIFQQIAPFTFVHGGKETTIDDERTVCGTCGSIVYSGDQISRHELAVAAKIRELDGLLSAEALRRIRLKYALRQTDLEAMLSIGPKTWTRWERGKVPQNKAADTLIRVLATDPEVARHLMMQANIDNPAADAVFAQIDEDTKRLAEANLRARIIASGRNMDIADMAQHAINAVREARHELGVQAA
ncbi:type II TA system antitoxin MqsA family protein [Rhodopila globiformis]|nr:type II TA system antitoxin MqsA family protein [Rhodopila globiformis]